MSDTPEDLINVNTEIISKNYIRIVKFINDNLIKFYISAGTALCASQYGEEAQ